MTLNNGQAEQPENNEPKIEFIVCTSKQRPPSLFPEVIGKFIVNCGFFEKTLDSLIHTFEKDKTKSVQIREYTYNQRVDSLLKLIASQITDQKFKKELRQCWKRTQKLMEFRNKIAHGPLLLTENEGLRILGGKKNFSKISIENLEEKIDETVILIEQLFPLMIRVKKEYEFRRT